MKTCLAVLCLLLALTGLPVYAATAENGYAAVELSGGKAVLVDSEGEAQAQTENTTEDAGDYEFTVTPGKTYYLNLGSPTDSASLLKNADDSMTEPVRAGELADSTLFKLRNEKSGSGSGLVSVAQYNEKSVGDSGRCSWLQFVVANTVATEELKAVCNLTFSARRDDDKGRYAQGDSARVSVTLYIQTPVKEAGDDFSADEKAAYRPAAGEKNEIVWDGVAMLSFAAGSEPQDFDVSLPTGGEEFRELADFSGAEIFVRDFTELPVLETGSRALLTLLNPWEVRGDDSIPDPKWCHVYEQDSEGNLSDMTALFTYGEVEGTGCWQMRTRKLGCYVLSDRELDLSGRRVETAGASTDGEEMEPVSTAPKAPEAVAPKAAQPEKSVYVPKTPNVGAGNIFSNIFSSVQ